MRIGTFTVDPVIDGELVFPREAQYPNVDDGRWEQHRHFFLDGAGVVNTVGGYLVRGNGRIVVVDLGIGASPVKPWNGGAFRSALLSYGVAPEDVTDVIFTHLHLDHIGWASCDGKPFFANATYRCDRRDWDLFCSDAYEPPEWEVQMSNPEDRASIRLAPVEAQTKFWEGSAPVLPGIDAIDAAGHTPGHCVLEISSDGERGMLVGDVAHSLPELLVDGWEGCGDEDPVASRVALARIRARLEDEGIPFAAAHFPGMRWGRIVRDGERRQWSPV